jgi:hypothetical protein
MTERTTVRLPEGLLAMARKKAAAEGRTLTALIEDGLRLVVAKKREPRPRIPVRISSAKGGPMPGYEEIKMSRIDEIEDLERMARLEARLRVSSRR